MKTSIAGGSKEVRDVASLWVEQGYTVEPNKGGHLTVRDKEGNYVTTLPNSPSDHRWRKNALSLFRRTIRERGSQEVKEESIMVNTKTGLEISGRQTELSSRVFGALKERGWPTTMNARAEFVMEAMRTARDMYGVEGSPWGSEGSAQAALTDLLSGKRIVSDRGLDVFDYITSPTSFEVAAKADEKAPYKRVPPPRVVEYATEESLQRATALAKAMVSEINDRNAAGIRKGHKMRFGTMKYVGVWADRTATRLGHDVYMVNGRSGHNPINSWTTRIRDLVFDNKDAQRMTAQVVDDVLWVGEQWAKASDQEKWQYINDPRMLDRHGISAPEGVRQVDPPPTMPKRGAKDAAAEADQIVAEVLPDTVTMERQPDTRALGFPVGEPDEPRVDTPTGTPLHMRVLYAIVAGADRAEALDLAEEVRKMEER